MNGLPPLPFGDYGDLAQAMVILAIVIVYAVSTRKSSTSTKTTSITENVDDSVLGRFGELFERIGKLEKALDETAVEVEALKDALAKKEEELAALRDAYNISLAEKDREIKSLGVSLENHRKRIKELERLLGGN